MSRLFSPLLCCIALLLTLSSCRAAVLRVNAAGPYITSVDFRKDLVKYLTSAQNTAEISLPPNTVQLKGQWNPVYETYRFSKKGNLQYRIPVPNGSYSVATLFAETYEAAFTSNFRVFNLLINGLLIRKIDVFASVGSNSPLYINTPNITPKDGYITITLERIPGKNNPMLSAFVISGPRASALVDAKTKPVVTLTPRAEPASPKAMTCANGILGQYSSGASVCCPSACKTCGGKGCANFSKPHTCCIGKILRSSPSCNVSKPPCVLSKPASVSLELPKAGSPCKKGLLGRNVKSGLSACCPTACKVCGGALCTTRVKGIDCCISTIVEQGKSCDNSPPPCVPTVLSLGNVNMSGKKKADSDEKPTPITKPPLVAPPVIAAPPSGSLACSVSGASPNAFRINVGGESISSAAMGADNMAYITSTDKGNLQSKSSLSISAAKGPATWDMAYSSHRWTTASVLKYNIPVLPGMYTVKLLFAEVVFSKPGQRTFDVFINGATKDTNLDVVKLTGKKNVGLVQTYKDVPAKTGVIEVTLVKSIENPMLSGIIIEGMGADAVAVGGGCIAGGPKPKKGDLNDGFDHRSHSVPGGPYMATDFDKSGRASVSLDGTQSHSHYSDPGPPEVSGKIVAYKWTWTEIAGGSTLKKVNTNKSGKFTASFPLGKTTVSLEVVDSTGDVATDTVVVEVKVSTQNGAYCYYYDFGDKTFSSVPIGKLLNSNPKPQFGSQQSTVDFNGQKDFADVPFVKNSFAVRCVFYINIPSNGAYAYTVHHNGPFQLYHGPTLLSQAQSKGKTTSQTFNFKGGLNQFQLIYFRPKNLPPLLVLSSKGNTLSSSALQHDSAATLPVIVGLSKATSAPSGGQNIQIFGSGFINGVAVKFGDVEATNLMSSSTGVVQVTVPPGSGEVFITVSTNAGMSNAFKFTYLSATTLQQPVIFKQEKLMDASGGVYKISFVSTATYGPDGRLYLGTTNEKLIALGINSKFVVTSKCERLTGKSRSVLGVAFSPFSKSLKMYFTTSSLYWKDKNIFNFEQGWNNGKIQSIEFSSKHVSDGPGQSCAGDIKDVVTGLPVSNHDHGLSKLQFLPDGSLIVGVGGFTNGGVSVPGNKPVPNDPKDDKLGGVSSNPLSAALVSCPYNKVTKIVYDQYSNPEKAKIVSPGACKVYASGFRNSFGMTVHTNGNLYATDNGPNASFGDFSTNCNGGKKPGKNAPDKLFLVQKGKFHGHPNINRKECQHYPPSAVQPIVGNFKSSSNGVIEYRSNTFGGDIKGNLYVAKFAGQHAGQVAQVKFGKDGGKSNVNVVPVFIPFSGLTIIEGPRGELVMPRVYQSEIVIAYPSYPAPDVTFLIGVHPKQGPASGGSRVLVSGHNFGSSPKATFGGSKCTNVIVIDDDSFSCLTPPKPKNTLVPVIVTGSAGVSPSYGSDFWYF